MSEEWRPVVGYEGLYEVSNLGRVRSLDRQVQHKDGKVANYRGRVRVVFVSPRNRRRIRLGRSPECSVSSLVLQAFVGPRPEGYVVCHNDGNSLNDCLSNLRWDTQASNIQDSVRHGTHSRASQTHCHRGHEFVEKNLVPSTMARVGQRECLACRRAKLNAQKAKRRGLPFDVALAADDHYAKIMDSDRRAA